MLQQGVYSYTGNDGFQWPSLRVCYEASFQKLKAHISISKSQALGFTATGGLAGSRAPSSLQNKGYGEDGVIAHAYPLSSSPLSR